MIINKIKQYKFNAWFINIGIPIITMDAQLLSATIDYLFLFHTHINIYTTIN